MKKNWTHKKTDAAKTAQLAESLGLPKPVAALLVSRGISSAAEAENFLRPSLADLHSPFLLPDMEKAVVRLRQAVDTKEKIIIYGDSDVDGVTSIAILVRTLKSLGADVEWMIPGTEGYGLHNSLLEKCRAQGAKLIVTVDNGTSALEEIRFANSIGLDVIVTDHHTQPDILPPAVAIVNPNLNSSKYPFPDLAGCLVAFKLAQALMFSFNRSFNQDYCVVDLETTALSPTQGTIVEIAAVHIRNFAVVDIFHTLINPERPIPPAVTQIHGITDEMVKDSPTLEQVLPKFLKFLGTKTIVAHNAPFDMGFLQAFCKLILDETITNPVVDTLVLARQHFPGDSHALTRLVERLNIKRENAHRALDDALATAVLLERIERARDPRLDHFLQDHLDLACLGTIADVVPLLGENRVIVKEGIPQLLRSRKPGLSELVLLCGFSPIENPIPPSAKDISWTITPHLNAAGRFDRADLTANLLLTDSQDEARKLVKEISKLNTDRRALQKDYLAKFLKLAQDQCDLENDPVLFVVADGLRQGVTGIVASHLTREYCRPAFLVIQEGAQAVGSSRSVPAVNVVEILKGCDDLLLRYGGHPQAAGFTVDSAKLGALKERILKLAREKRTPGGFEECIDIDHALEVEEITKGLVDAVARLEPFGQGNPVPIFSLRSAFLKGISQIGAQKNHLKLVIGNSRLSVGAVGWSLAARLEEFSVGAGHDFAFHLEMDRWNGRETPRLVILDVGQPSGAGPGDSDTIQLDLAIG